MEGSMRVLWFAFASVAAAALSIAHAEPRPRLVEEAREFAIEGAVRGGAHTRLVTPGGVVHVWVPDGYDARTAQLVVYLHGYFVTLDEAWLAHGLPEQFGAAGINAMFVACETPSSAREGVRWANAAELVDVIAPRLRVPLPRGRRVAIGHSGAYRTLIPWLADPALDTVVMLDAGYGEREPYVTWIRGDAEQRRRLITISSETAWWGGVLHGSLPGSRSVATALPRLSAEELGRLARERVVHLRDPALDHWQTVTTALPVALRLLGAAAL
jgi:hypothetical protein